MSGAASSSGGLGPTFLVVGTAKAGTSSLYDLLRQHPDVFMAPVKEPHHFSYETSPGHVAPSGKRVPLNDNAMTDRDTYLRLFDGAPAGAARGECSATYLYEPVTAARIAAFDPAMRIVAVLRDPVERAYSSFNHARRAGVEPETDFLTAVDAEAERIAANATLLVRYLDLGRYAEQLRRYREVFPAEQLLAVRYEDLAERPGETVAGIYRHIGVDDGFVPDLGVRRNVSAVPRADSRLHRLVLADSPVNALARRLVSRQRRDDLAQWIKGRLFDRPDPLDPAVAAELRGRMAGEVAELEELLGWDLTAWKPSGVIS